MFTNKYTTEDFDREFPDKNACLLHLFRQQYGDDPVCPHCGERRRFYRITTRASFGCTGCKHQVYPMRGTILEGTPLKNLRLWFKAIYEFNISKHGVNAVELADRIGVAYKTAWRMAQKIRSLMDESGTITFTNGRPVEADEAWLGGKDQLDNWKSGDKKRKDTGRKKRQSANPRRGRGKGSGNKMIVVAAKQRGGKLLYLHIPDRSGAHILPFLTRLIPPACRVFTDKYVVYKKLGEMGYDHRVIQAKTSPDFLHAGVHTNNIETSWTQPKTAIRGTYRSVSPRHLQGYLNMFSFHHNRRGSARGTVFRDLVTRVAFPAPTPFAFWPR